MVSKHNLIQKLGAVAANSTLELTVTKKLGPVATSAGVASTGSDDQHFSDTDLTPGPAVMALDPNNTYSVLWDGAFADAGSATLRVRVLDAAGSELMNQVVPVRGERGDVFFRLILVG